MTETLRTLLHDEVDRLEVPSPRTHESMAHGRRLVRRRRLAVAGGVAASLAVAAVVAATVTSPGQRAHRLDPADGAPVAPLLAFAVGDTVYSGDGTVSTTLPEVAQSLYYTSAGVVVRTNADGSSDGGAPFHFELIHPDGTATPLGVTLGEVVPATDAAQPYLAWAKETDGHIAVVVWDVAQDREVTTVDVPGTFTWGGWAAPPVALSGDRVYVGTDGQTTVVDWRTGTTQSSSTLPAEQVPVVSGGHIVVVSHQGTAQATAEVLVAGTEADLLDVPVTGDEQVSLSPDGDFLAVWGSRPGQDFGTVTVYHVGTAGVTTVYTRVGDLGWTSDGDLVQVVTDSVSRCDPIVGSCASIPTPTSIDPRDVRYAGRSYES